MVEQYTTPQEIRVMWERPKINLAELAKKRWIDGWSVKQLGDEWGYKRTSIKAYLRNLRNGEIGNLDLNETERKDIIEAIEVEREKITEYLKSKGPDQQITALQGRGINGKSFSVDRKYCQLGEDCHFRDFHAWCRVRANGHF